MKHSLRYYFIIFYIAFYTSYTKLFFVLENIPSYNFFYTLLLSVNRLRTLHLRYNMQKYKYLQIFFSETTMGEIG